MGRSIIRLWPVCILLLVAACGDGGNSADTKSVDIQTVQWQRLLDALNLPDKTILEVVLPDDIRAHPESIFESFEMRAMLRNEVGEWFSLSGQIDRLQVASQSDAQSAWAFDSIARARVSGGGESKAKLRTREELARVALDLANSTPTDIHVRDTRYTLNPGGECTAALHFQGRDVADEAYSLVGKPSTCPQSSSGGFLNQWEFPAISIQGSYADESVHGYVWFTHRWGNAVLPGGAVLLDQVRIQLSAENKAAWLTVNRTKRASGRGPRTVEALFSEDQKTFESINVEWEDQGLQLSPVTELSYPQAIVLRIPSKGYELTLKPVIELSEVRDSLGSRWSGGVIVMKKEISPGSGSGPAMQSGTGFLDFQALSLKE